MYHGGAGRWQRAVVVVDTTAVVSAPVIPDADADLADGLIMGIRDYCSKTRQHKVVLGLSGGLDSALVAALAVEALGPEAVTGLLMPGPYSSPGSLSDAWETASSWGSKRLNYQSRA